MRALKIDQSITGRDQVSLQLYLQDIRKFPVLTAEEEVKLGKKIQEGDQSALEKLINSNLRFVVSVAKKYEAQGLRLEDLVAEGNVGLITAAKRFDHTKGFKFISFAVWYIRQAMQSAVDAQRRIVRLPTNHLLDILNIRKTSAQLEQQLEREPTLVELSEVTLIDIEKLRAYQYSSKNSVFMDADQDGEQEGLYAILADSQVPSPDQNLHETQMSEQVQILLARLPEREREIIKLMYGFYGAHLSNVKDISRTKDVCEATIRRYHHLGLKLIKESNGLQKMRDLLSN